MFTRRLAAPIALWVILSGCTSPGSSIGSKPEAPTDPYLVRWERLSGQAHRLESKENGLSYEYELVAAHNMFWKDVYAKCRDEAQNEHVELFYAIAVIDRDGTITEFLPKPNSTHFRCFTTEMVGRKYPKPPVSPFYELFDLHLPVK